MLAVCASLNRDLERDPSFSTMAEDNCVEFKKRRNGLQVDIFGRDQGHLREKVETCMASTVAPKRFDTDRNDCVT